MVADATRMKSVPTSKEKPVGNPKDQD